MNTKQNKFEIITKSAEETKRVGSFFSEEANNFFSKNSALILCLNGDLGGGKTAFTQGLAKGFGIKQKVNSPTFLIIKKYSVKKNNFKNFYHLDCYRLENPRELIDLGFKEIVSDKNNFIVIEWAEKIKKILPSKNAINFQFDFLDFNRRKITIKY
jgi:tRNA threonylcarbamoyladenosine biosynthesis protein TsaE